MDNDDAQIGRILSRREILRLVGVAGVGMLVGCGPDGTGSAQPTVGAAQTAAGGAQPVPTLNAEAQTAVTMEGDALATQEAEVATAAAANATLEAANATALPACVVRPEVTEGPYYVDEDLVRSDIRSDPADGTVREGTPLVLTFNVSQVSGGSCTTLQGAEVEIWHCDAAGQYSDVRDPGGSTVGQKWLRGSQVTDANGLATFTTIYPGWYRGRAVHIHFKVRPNENQMFTSQLFFDEATTDQAHTRAPYSSRGQRDTLNSTDNIFQETLLLTTSQTDQGYAATFPIGIDLSTIGTG
jgi:protocatechuate 3,4-dioxygenase beta subunit